MTEPRYPALYQVNTRVWLSEIGRRLGRRATLDDVPDDELDRISALGFDWVWFLGVWNTGAVGRRVSRENPQWQVEFRQILPDLSDDDICGSCFAITGYAVHPALGGGAAMRRLRDRVHARGLRLMLDFVPNHMAPDHPWTHEHPDWFVRGDDSDVEREPHNWCRIVTPDGSRVFAHGRDPYFPGWPDTVQLNYGNPDLQTAMRAEVLRIAELCDGVRCDMAMLIHPAVFQRTWDVQIEPFWPDAIAGVRRDHPNFCFMAEVYWDLEWELQQQGFDYAYDKRLYDRLREENAPGMREHLIAGLEFQDKLARFLENHDEPRAAATFARGMHEAAAVITFFAPGLRFFYQGQLQGARVRVPVHLCRGPDEPIDDELTAFYETLLGVLRQPIVRSGDWVRIEPQAAWDGNDTWDGFVAGAWCQRGALVLLVVVNFAHTDAQCHVRLPFADLVQRRKRLRDLLSESVYDRDGSALISPGLYLDMPAWGYHVFSVEDISAE
jgi:SAM-dependent methyltransferase